MSVPRFSRRARRTVLSVALVMGLVAPAVELTSTASADPSPEVGAAVAAFETARDHLRAAEATKRDAEARQAEAQQVVTSATEDLREADATLADQRGRYARLSAEYYVRQGSDDDGSNDSMRLALAGRREVLDRAKASQASASTSLKDASKTLTTREKARSGADTEYASAQAEADATGAAADTAIADTGARDLPAVAYIAYRDAAAATAAAFPECHVSAAVLAGIGRISSGHGRNQGSTVDHLGRVDPALRGIRGQRTADTDGGTIDGDDGADRAVGPFQLSPAQWATGAVDGDGDGVTNPDSIFDSAATAGSLLCTDRTDLDTFAPLDRAVDALLGEGQQTTVALGAARRYSRTDGLDLGPVPADPRAGIGDGSPQFDTSDTDFAPGDVLGMIDWAMGRLGTPYSQCLGIDARPQDPECPPGTNRFGSGFFDCSGFVSSAYRRIGITIPATTYAMEANPAFMATQVAGGIDLTVMEPGDVFLMDGHTGMYVGGGMIIHAISAGLTYEPVPGWVRNGTFAVLRPLDLLGPPLPA